MLYFEVFLAFFLFYLVLAYAYGFAVDNWELLCLDRAMREGGWVMMTGTQFEEIKERVEALDEDHQEILELLEQHNAERHPGG